MATALTQAVHQNLECPICLSFFKDPKILTCSHTFCKGCLETLFKFLPDEQSLSCPVCRGVTPIPDGNVSKLQTSKSLRSLVADVGNQDQLCSYCDPQDKSRAVAYCKECGEYLCIFCNTVHLKWARFSKHSILPASDVLSGKIPLKRRHKCQKHPTEDEHCFCFTCRMYVCFRCGALEHAREGHKIAEAFVHEIKQKKSIKELSFKAEEKIDAADQFIASVAEEREKLQKLRKKLNDDIDETFDDSVRKLTERKELLKSEVGQPITELETLLAGIADETREQVSKVTAICGLVKNGLKVPFHKEALTAHTTLCQELEEFLRRVAPDEEQLRKTGEQREHLHFERSKESSGLELGQVCRGDSKWVLVAEQQLPTEDSMSGMAASPRNTISVGCHTGGIVTYSADGHLQETVMENVKVRRLQYFPDGRFLVRVTKNHVTLYSTQHEDLGVRFDTLTVDQGGFGGFARDKYGHVLIGYAKAEMIQAFQTEGGRAVREIPFDGNEPKQIFAMTSGNRLVVSSTVNSVHLIGGLSGATIHSCVSKDGFHAFPCVGNDDSVSIAWVNHDEGQLTIDLYTRELAFKKTLIDKFKIVKSERCWYYLQVSKSGRIAFCTPDRLYIFKEILE